MVKKTPDVDSSETWMNKESQSSEGSFKKDSLSVVVA